MASPLGDAGGSAPGRNGIHVSRREILALAGLALTAGMPGRLRAYDLDMQDGSRRAAVGIAVSRRCDLLVAVAYGKGNAAEVRRAALEYLGSSDMTRWMSAAMDGG